MSSAKGFLLNAIGKLVLRETTIASITELAPTLRAIAIEGASLRDVAWTPGDKIQVLLSSLDVRTYTPVSWDHKTGATKLVVYDHGDSPGASWSRRAKLGDVVKFVGPQRSLSRSSKPCVLFGDETSIGVAVALAGRPGLSAVLEVSSPADVMAALTALGVDSTITCVQRSAGDAHLGECATKLSSQLTGGAELVLTGRAQSIKAIQNRLRSSGIRAGSNKAYWSVGKTGLD
jgi:NADPH-dependent ferric siderophore reductase